MSWMNASQAHTVEEARAEVQLAGTFGRRKPAQWAVDMVREADSAERGVDMLALFKEAGLCEESARRAAEGLSSGRYFSFEDAAFSQTMWDGANGQPRRNARATTHSIAEAAKKAEAAKPLEEVGGSFVTVDGKRERVPDPS